MRATKIIVALAILMLTLLSINVSADTGCPAVACSIDKDPSIVEISVSKVYGKTVKLVGVVKIDTSSLSNNSVRNWIWDFGDGTISKRGGLLSRIGDNAFKISVSHTYSDYRMYTVNLTVKDYCGKYSSKTIVVNIKKSNYNPVIELKEVTPNPAEPGEKVTFVAEGIDPDGQVVAYYWDFGDGKEVSGPNLARVTHVYSKEGTYTVRVRVEDDKGALSGYATEDIFVRLESKPKPKNKAPVIESVKYTPKEPKVGSAVYFRITAVDPEGDKISFEWNFGDGATQKGGAQVSHVYRKEGAFTVKIRAIDSKGASSSYTLSIAVKGNKNPQASIIEVKTLDNKTFIVQGMGVDPDGQVVAYYWDFGDGKEVSGPLEGNSIPHSPLNHTYTKSGNYTIRFKVKDDKGAWSPWVSKKIRVLVPEKVNSATLGGFNYSDVGMAVGVGMAIVLAAGYMAYRESKSNAFIERAKRRRKVVVKRSKYEKSSRSKLNNVRRERKKRPWP